MSDIENENIENVVPERSSTMSEEEYRALLENIRESRMSAADDSALSELKELQQRLIGLKSNVESIKNTANKEALVVDVNILSSLTQNMLSILNSQSNIDNFTIYETNSVLLLILEKTKSVIEKI